MITIESENMNLIVTTISKTDEKTASLIDYLKQSIKDIEVIHTEEMNIKGCVGCNYCWLITPGKCVINDDYEKLLIKFLEAEQIIFITESELGFVSYKLKNIIDRMLPLATMYLKFKNGQMRHYPRYKKHFNMGLIYKGNAEEEFLEKWFKRVMLNFDGTSLGVFSIESKEAIKYALTDY